MISRINIPIFGLPLHIQEYNMIEKITPDNILLAVDQMFDRLRFLVEDNLWAELEAPLKQATQQLRQAVDENDKRKYALQILQLLRPYTKAFQQLVHKVEVIADMRTRLESEFSAIIPGFPLSDHVKNNFTKLGAEIITIDDERFITGLQKGGIGGATSYKLKNIQSVEQLFGLITEIFVASTPIILTNDPHPLAIGVAVLVIIRNLIKATTCEITPDQASVLWGILQTKNQVNVGTESAIFKITNNFRKEVNLPELTHDQAMVVLRELEKMKAIEIVNNNSKREWRLRENISNYQSF